MNFDAGKPIGPAFVDEIASLTDRRFAWGADGRFTYADDMAQASVDALKAVIVAHNPATARSQAAQNAEVTGKLDSNKFLKAVVLWQASLHAKTIEQARAEILTIYWTLP